MTDCLVTKGRADFTVLVVTTTFVSVYSDLLSLWLQCVRKKKKNANTGQRQKMCFPTFKTKPARNMVRVNFCSTSSFIFIRPRNLNVVAVI